MKTREESFKEFILDNIDFEGYSIKGTNLITNGLDIFRKEYDHEIKKVGEKKAFIEYLKGLPSWLSVPAYYFDIRNLMYSLGYEVLNVSDNTLDGVYYEEIYKVFFPQKNRSEEHTSELQSQS